MVASKEFSSKSEVVNDLIRKVRNVESTRILLIEAQKSGFITQSKDTILAEFKIEASKNGRLKIIKEINLFTPADYPRFFL